MERNTVEAQREFLRAFAHLHGLTVRGEYTDDGVTGTLPLAKRPDGRRLLDDARAKSFGCVVVYRVDRLGRSLTALLDAHAALEGLGIAIRSATEPFDTTTPIGTFLFQLLGSLAELEKSTITERMMLGRDRALREGRWTSGVLPFGYALDAQHQLQPSTRPVDSLGMTEAEIARDIFVRMANGSTAVEECRRLTMLGVPTARRYRGGKVATRAAGWGPTRLTQMLRNPVYIGHHVFRSRHGEIERSVPAIIDQQTWEQAQAQLQKNRHLPKNGHARTYLLRGLIHCGICGASYVGSTRTRPGVRPYAVYRCGGRLLNRYPHQRLHRGGRHLKTDWIEPLIWDRCRAFIQNPDAALLKAREQLRERLQASTHFDDERSRLQHAVGEKALERDRVMTVFRRGVITVADLEGQLAAIASEEAALRQQLAQLEARQQTTDTLERYYLEAHTLLTSLQEKADLIDRTNAIEIKRQVIEALVGDILVESDGTVRFTYRFSPDGSHISLSV
jgi:site-specific DNA recombinase